MRQWLRPGGELAVAVVAFVLAAVCWNEGTNTAPYLAIADGAPSFEVTAYSGSWLLVAAALLTVAGLLVVDAIRLRIGD